MIRRIYGRPYSLVRRLTLFKLSLATLTLAFFVSLVEPGNSLAQQPQPAKEDKIVKPQDGADQGQSGAGQDSGLQTDRSERLPAVHKYRVDRGFLSLYFTAVPLAAVVLLIILALWLGSGDIKERLVPFFGDGQFGQYVVVILVAGNVCSLAIVGILGSSEVAAIYGGIIGYVLGKKPGGNGAPPPNVPPPAQPNVDPPKQ